LDGLGGITGGFVVVDMVGKAIEDKSTDFNYIKGRIEAAAAVANW
jgi:hypothetical protein